MQIFIFKGVTIIKITAFVGSARKKHTYEATKKFLKSLQRYGDIEYEIVMLSDYKLHICKGCKLCLDKEEDLCPLEDDRDILIKKIKDSDGIVLATPNYSFQVSGLMKVFLDRLAFFFHRPQFFGKTYTNIVVQGIYGGKKIIEYLNQIGNGLGFNVKKGVCLKSLEPISKKQEMKNNKKIDRLSEKYYKQLIKQDYPNPSIFKLILFRMSRSSIKVSLNEDYKDYRHYKEKGWFDSSYYYPVKLIFLKQIIGLIFDKLAVRMSKNDKS